MKLRTNVGASPNEQDPLPRFSCPHEKSSLWFSNAMIKMAILQQNTARDTQTGKLYQTSLFE